MNQRLSIPAFFLLGVVTIVLLLAGTASATVVGDLEVGAGNGTFTFSLASMTFNLDTAANPPGPPWNAEVTNTTSLRFAGCASGVLGTPGCLDAAPFDPAEGIEFAENAPITAGGGLGPNNPFIQFAGNGVTHAAILYTVTALGPGSSNTVCSGLAIGQSCSLFPGSPLILTDTATGTLLGLSAFGSATDGTGTSSWVGGFTEPIAGMSPNQIEDFLCPPSGTCTAADFALGKSITKPWSGDFIATATTVTPEPGSLFLFGSGLTVLAGFLRRKLVPWP